MDGYDIFLVGRPNTIAAWSSRRLLIFGLLLITAGLVCLVDAILAFHWSAVKTYGMKLYFNTHWINVVHLLTGITYVLCDRHKLNFFLFLSVLLSITSLAVGLGSVVGSCVNIQSVRQLEAHRQSAPLERSKGFSDDQIRSAIICNGVDIFFNFIAMSLSSAALLHVYHMSTRYFQAVCNPSGKLVTVGVLTVVVGATKFALWVAELVWLHSSDPRPNFTFLNYTFDEPIWILLYIISGSLVTLVGLRGSRIVIHVALILTALSYHPVVQYLWVDYRWGVQMNFNRQFLALPLISPIIWTNLALAIAHLVLIIVTVFILCKTLMNSRAQGFLFSFGNVTTNVRLMIGCISLALVLLGLLFLVSDILNIQQQSFYRIFWPTEQKLPFILVPAGVICLLMFQDKLVSYLLMPVSCVLLLQSAQYCLFHIAAYLYLSAIHYAPGRFCSRYLEQPARCDYILKLEASVAHFVEALAGVVVLAISIVGAVLLGRLMGLYQISIGTLTSAKQQQKTWAERLILLTGVAQLLMALVVIPYVAVKGTWGKGFEGDPLFVLHGSISLACFCAPFLILPLVHICFAPQLHLFPLRSIAIMVAGGIRLVDIFMQLDGRSIQMLNPVILVILSAELICVAMVFITVIAAGLVLDVSINHLPQFDFMEEPPASLSGDHIGGFSRTEDFQVAWRPEVAPVAHLSSHSRLGFNPFDSHHDEPTSVHSNDHIPVDPTGAVGTHDKMLLIS